MLATPRLRRILSADPLIDTDVRGRMTPFSPLMARHALAAALLIGAGALHSAPAAAQTAATPPAAQGQVRLEAASGEFEATARVNLRQLPGPQGKRLGALDVGEKVRVTGKVANMPWVAVVRADGGAGFVLAELLRPAPAAPQPVAPQPVAPEAAASAPAPSAASPAPAAATPVPADDGPVAALARRLSGVEELLGKLTGRADAALKSDEARDAALRAVVSEQRAIVSSLEAFRTEMAEPQSLRPVNERISALSERLELALKQIAASALQASAQTAAAAAPSEQALAALQAKIEETAANSQRAVREVSDRVAALAENLRRHQEQTAAQIAEVKASGNAASGPAPTGAPTEEPLPIDRWIHHPGQPAPQYSSWTGGIWQAATLIWWRVTSPWW